MVAVARRVIAFIDGTVHVTGFSYPIKENEISYYKVNEKNYFFLSRGYTRIVEGTCITGDIAIDKRTFDVCSTANLVHRNIKKCDKLHYFIYRKFESLEEKYDLKPLSFLEKLPTKRLLNCYRIERKKFDTKGFFCSCCNEPMWDIHTGYTWFKKEYEEWSNRLEAIKAILAKREHVERKVLKNKK